MTAAIFKNKIPYIFGVDTTILLLAVSLLGLIIKQYRNRLKILFYPSSYLYIALFISILTISLFYTANYELGFDKYIRFLILTSSPFFIIILLFRDYASIKRVLILFILVNIIFLLIGIPTNIDSLQHEKYFRFSLLGGNPISSAINMGVSFFLILTIYKTNSRKDLVLKAIILFFLFVSLLAANSKGPFLSFILTLLIFYFFFIKRNISMRTIFSVSTIIVIIYILTILPENITYRHIGFFTSTNIQGISSVESRIYLQNEAIDIFIRHPFLGIGLAGFENIYGVGNYPHNIFLELLAETGIIGLLFYILFILNVLLKGIQLSKFEEQKPLINSSLISLIFVAISYQVSGNLNDWRLFFFFSGIIILINKLEKIDEEQY